MKKSEFFVQGVFAESMIIWRDFSAIKPPESGEYLTITESGNVMIMKYSRLWNAFNVDDSDISDRYSIAVFAWAPVPQFVEFFQKMKKYLEDCPPFFLDNDEDDELTDFDIDFDELPDDDLADEITAEFNACLDSEV